MGASEKRVAGDRTYRAPKAANSTMVGRAAAIYSDKLWKRGFTRHFLGGGTQHSASLVDLRKQVWGIDRVPGYVLYLYVQ